jgi:hypothetical protein
MSTRKANPRKIQSIPTKPTAGLKTMAYVSVVQGRNMIPKIVRIQELKAIANRIGLSNHQIPNPTRGPRKTRVVKKQHI